MARGLGPLVRIGICAGTLVLGHASALAHHPVAEQSAGHEQPASRVALEVGGGRFSLPYGHGSLFVATLAADLAIGDRLSVGTRLPMVLVDLGGNEVRAGLGDLDFVGKVRIAGQSGRSASVGLSLEVPTGNEDQGLGSGHFEISPFLSGAWTEGPWLLHATVGDSISVGGAEGGHEHADVDGGATTPHDHGAHGSFVSPHADHELQYHVGVLRELGPVVFANLTVGGATALTADELGETSLVLGPEVGVRPGDALRLTTGLQVPFAGPRRFDWKVTMAVELRF